MAECEENDGAKHFLNSGVEPLKLLDLFDGGWKILEEIDSTNEPLGSNSTQSRVKLALRMLEEASRMVAQLDLFSHNEELEEVATADLKYLLLPALLGSLTLKQTRMDKRLEIIQAAQAYFMDFLRRCKDYDVSPFELPKMPNENQSPDRTSQNGFSTSVYGQCSSDLVSMAAQRQAKIEQYRKRKQLESRLSDVQKTVDSGQADDEVIRDFYLLNVKRWITVCLEETESIGQELEMLKKIDVVRQGSAKQPAQPVRPAVKSFILTRDAVQAQVFGAGYPSLHTMTVNDWYEQHRKQEHSHDQGMPVRTPVEEDTDLKEREEEEEEYKSDDDDDLSLRRARNWDDWKDTHRKGYGNRQNMG